MLRRVRGGLLSQPISSLLAAVEKEQYNRAVAESAAAARSAGASPGGRGGSGGGAGGSQRGSLWVDKYAPQSYIDLLSDEQINREVVRWLKSWDPCVFGRGAAEQRAQRGRVGRPHDGSGWQQHNSGSGSGSDALGRPEHKVILIAGPPGLGKTTMAHVCAAHCGYRPVEINASDERGGAALTTRVLDAVQMQSVMDRERRPNCVIIDEIDGAAGGAEGRSGIAALLKIINATGGKAKKDARSEARQGALASDGADESDDEPNSVGDEGARSVPVRRAAGPSGSARAPTLRPLLRPIICICNDLYAPALRPLRDVARVFRFNKPQAERLAQRLQSICAAEGLGCEKSTLRLLVERAECDVRSCLNTLQFLAKKRRVVRQADLAGLRVGHKDMTKGAFALWTELLHNRKNPGIVGKMAETGPQRAARLYDTLQDFGEGELVLGGLHENLLGLRFFDMALQRTSGVLNQLGDADALLRACMRSGDFGMLKYVPAPVVQVSCVLAGPDRPQLQWPRAIHDAHRRAAANAAQLKGWMLGMSPGVCAATSARSMVLEVLPSLMHIAAPALRPVSQHLYSPAEQETVGRLVDTLLCYNLRYCLDPSLDEPEEEAGAAQHSVRGAQAEAPLRFRPAVHRTCVFTGLAPKGKQLPAAVRQTISHEADLEAIRRSDAARRGTTGTSANPAVPVHTAGAQAAALAASNRAQAAPRSGPVPLTLAERMKAAGTAINAVRRQASAKQGTWLDQLKEQQQARASTARGETGSGAGRHKFPVLYKFHEGYTNAVKRPVLMQDLL